MPICPVCTVAIGAGLGISQLLGIDDAVTSIWIGAFLLVLSFWTHKFISKKFFMFNKTHYFVLTTILMYLLILIPLYFQGYIGRATNQLFGIDKIIFGTTLGTLGLIFGEWLDTYERRKRKKILFPYQKVIFPISILLALSFIMEIVVRYV